MAPVSSPDACPLCGTELDPGERRCRSSCPMSAGCILVCCPRCSYTFPNERLGLAGVLRRLFQRRRGR